jgi:Zn-dependent M28 family amino/carboxypeptidase
MSFRCMFVAAVAFTGLFSACSAPKPAELLAPAPAAIRPVPLGQLPDLDMKAVLAHTRTLASDEFEGRAPGTAGESKTVGYLVGQFKAMGLEPGNTDGSYTQDVPLVGIKAAPAPLIVRKGSAELTLKYRDDVVAWTKRAANSVRVEDSELVFVGYGVVAPEYNWDDFKGVDVAGKTLVMLINDPPVPDADNPSQLDPKTFGGRAMTYYGRWSYKYEIAAQKGAAGALIIHETEPAGYPFAIVQDSNTGEKFDLVTRDRNASRTAIEGWITLEQGKRILGMAGQDFDALKKSAATREFKPVPLGVTASMVLQNTLRTIRSRNVAAKISGADPDLSDQYVIYTAHWDHFGKKPEGIFHGAQDDALGCAALLEIARAFTKLAVPPRRSVLFLAVTGEEQGLLGSQYYAVAPIYPLSKTAADINMDAWNVSGRTKDLVLVRYGASDLDDYARDAAAEQGRIVHAEAEPEKGFYYRSDHFSFARQGVPALAPQGGENYMGKPPEYGEKIRSDWTRTRYHKPADVVLPDWDLSGVREDLKVFLAVGYRVAQSDQMPNWKPGNEFKAKRDAMLKR